MGEAAARLADRVIVTDDNPRSEDAERIVAMILERHARRPAARSVERDRARGDRRRALPRRGPATSCWSPARATRTTRSSAASGARSATASACAHALRRRGVKGRLADVAAATRRAPRGRRRGVRRRVDRHPHARARASCSSRCAASASTATTSSRPRPRARRRGRRGRRRPVDGAPAAGRRPRHAGRARRARARLARHAAARSCSASPAATARRRSRRCWPRSSRGAGPTLATRGNLNNHIGVPLTLLRLEPSHRYAVIEMGMNHPGEIAALAAHRAARDRARHQRRREHLEGFGDLAGVARAEGEMFAALAAERHRRDQRRRPVRASCGRRCRRAARASLRFGSRRRPTCARGHRRAASKRAPSSPCSRSRSATSRRAVRLRSPAGTTCERARRGGRGARRGRRAARRSSAGPRAHAPVAGPAAAEAAARAARWLIDDTYNANPSSVRAGIDVLREPAGRALAGARRHGRGRRRRPRRATPGSATTRARAASPPVRDGRRGARTRSTPSAPRASWYADAAQLLATRWPRASRPA